MKDTRLLRTARISLLLGGSLLAAAATKGQDINEFTTGNNLGSPSNWSLAAAPTGNTSAGSHKDILISTSSTLLSHSGTFIYARSHNVTNGTSYTIRSNRSPADSGVTTFRIGSTGSTAPLPTTFTNAVSGIENDLIVLSNNSNLTFDGVNPIEGGLPPVVNLPLSGNFNISEGSTLTIGMNVTGNGAVTINGNGSTILSGSHSGTGTFTLNNGTILISGSRAGGGTNVRNGTFEITGTNGGTSYTIANSVDNPPGTAPVLKLGNVNALPATAAITGSDSILRAGSVNLAVAGAYTMGSYVRGNITFTNSSGSPTTLTFTGPSAITTGANSTRNLTNASADLGIVFAGTLDIGSSVDAHVNLSTTGNITVEGGITSTGTATRELRKFGAGTLTINGTSSYAGATSVNAGTLALGASGTIGTSPLVTIAAGAVLDVDAKTSFAMAGAQPFTFGINPAGSGTSGSLSAQELVITDAVVALNPSGTLDDPVYVLATYTSLDGTQFASVSGLPSGYELKYDHEGNKIALVALPVAGFDSWKTTNNATGQSLADDHDDDGVKNGVEYFLGGPNGNTTGFTGLPGVDGETMSITWNKGTGYTGTYGTDFWVETSDTLTGTWTKETIPGGNITDDPDFVKFTFPSPLGTKTFARLAVTGP